MEAHRDAADPQLLPVADRLNRAREVRAVAQAHQIDGLLCGQHRAMAGPRVVGVAMGDERAGHRPDRVDVKATARAIKSGGRGHKQVLRAHPR